MPLTYLCTAALRTWWAIFALVWMMAGAAPAQEVDCTLAETQQDMNLCAAEDWQAADGLLNEAYGKAMKFMKAIDADLPAADQGAALNLRNSQRAWIEFRDAACAAEGYLMYGGSAAPLRIYGCMTRLTAARTAELQQLSQTY